MFVWGECMYFLWCPKVADQYKIRLRWMDSSKKDFYFLTTFWNQLRFRKVNWHKVTWANECVPELIPSCFSASWLAARGLPSVWVWGGIGHAAPLSSCTGSWIALNIWWADTPTILIPWSSLIPLDWSSGLRVWCGVKNKMPYNHQRVTLLVPNNHPFITKCCPLVN